MFKQCEPQSWSSHCFKADLSDLTFLVTISNRGTSRWRNIQNSGCCGSRRISWIELLLHCTLKETEVNGALTSSKKQCWCGARVLWTQHRSDCCPKRDHQCSLWSDSFSSNPWLMEMLFFKDMLSKLLTFIFFQLQLHLVGQDCNRLTQAPAQRECE